MAIMACVECKKDVSDTAGSCPHCGAKVPRSGLGWFGKTVIGLGSAFALVMFIGSCAQRNDPDYEARLRDQRVYEMCIKDRDEAKWNPSRQQAIGYMCEGLRLDFKNKWKREP